MPNDTHSQPETAPLIPVAVDPSVKSQLDRVEAAVAHLTSMATTLVAQVQSVDGRVSAIEFRTGNVEGRLARHSDRASALQGLTTEEDLALKASLANEMTARKTLEEKVDAIQETNDVQNKKIDSLMTSNARLMAIGSKLENVVDKPLVKTAIGLVLMAIVQILTQRYGVRVPLPQGSP